MEEQKHIGVGCGVMVFRDGKLLLGLRNTDPEKANSELHEEGTWTMPGGNVEYGEELTDAAKREAKEETDMLIDDIEIICIQTDKNQYAHYISVGMIAHQSFGDPKVMEPDEIVKWEWFDLDHLPQNIFSPSKKTIECYLNHRVYME